MRSLQLLIVVLDPESEPTEGQERRSLKPGFSRTPPEE